VVLADGLSSVRDVLADPARYNDLKRRYEAFRDSLTPERWAQVREETQDTKADLAVGLAKTLEGKQAAKVAAALPKESLLAALPEETLLAALPAAARAASLSDEEFEAEYRRRQEANKKK
jgi:hypothetical protein